jgi:hypothetical protein
MESESGFFFELDSPQAGGPLADQVLAFQRQLQRDNTFIESHYDHYINDHYINDHYDY